MNQEKLDDILESHGLWLQRGKKYGKQAYLENTNLQNMNLQGARLQRAILEEANLQGANLQNANLKSADCSKADFKEADLQGANFQNANLQKANFQNANLQGAKLQNAQVHDVIFRGTNLQKANFRNTDLQGTDLRGADFQGANFYETHFQRVNAVRSNFRGTHFQKVNFEDVDLREADFRGASFRETSIQWVNFQKANLQNVDFQNAGLEGIKWENAILDGITIDFENFQKIPKDLIQKYGDTFTVKGYQSPQIIKHFLEFPQEYKEAGLQILNFFGTVLERKYPKMKVKVNIEQEGKKVAMAVQAKEEYQDIIKRSLGEYGLVIQEKMELDQFTTDPLLAVELKQQLSLARCQIDNQKILLDFERQQLKIQINKYDDEFSENLKKVQRKEIQISTLLQLLGKVLSGENISIGSLFF